MGPQYCGVPEVKLGLRYYGVPEEGLQKSFFFTSFFIKKGVVLKK